jgi:glycosyltransferase involved in cell wall biosynthesis
MKILFVSDSYYPHVNGVYYFVSRIGPLLLARGHDVAVIAPSGSFNSYQRKIDSLNVYGLASLPVPTYPTVRIAIPVRLKSSLKKIIESYKPDVIHIQDHFFICKAIVEVNRDYKIPIIGTNHLMLENFTVFLPGYYLKKQFEKILWRGLSDVFNKVRIATTPSESGVRLIKSRLKVDVVAISNGVCLEKFNRPADTSFIRSKYSIPDKPVLLYVGRLDPEKHIEEILTSVAAALSILDFRLVIVGKGTSRKKLEKLIRKLKITEKVIFTGFVPDEELPCFYKLSRCFIIASIAELLSLVTLQAMASGLPIIAVEAGALTELVKDRINGFLYTEGDIPTIVRHIQEIMLDDDLREKMSRMSLHFAREHDINKIVESFEKLYYHTVEENKVGEKGMTHALY